MTLRQAGFDEWDPSLPDDGLVIVFSSNREGSPHVYYAARPGRDSAFGAALADSVGGIDLYVVEATP